MIKAGIIADGGLFSMIERTPLAELVKDSDLLREAVYRAIKVKADIVERDEREHGDRRKLNLGHTLAHAIEKSSSKMNHGEAVAVGLALIADAAVRRGLLAEADRERICSLLQRTGFDLTPPVAMRVLLKAVSKDKKSEGDMLHVVFPTAIGAARCSHAIEEFRAMFA